MIYFGILLGASVVSGVIQQPPCVVNDDDAVGDRTSRRADCCRKKNYPNKIDGGKDGACLFVYCTYQYHVVPCSTGQSKPRAHSRTIRPSGVWLDWPYTIRVFSVDTQTGWCRGPRPRTGSRCLRSVPGRHGVRRTERTTHGEVEESRLPEVHAIQVTM